MFFVASQAGLRGRSAGPRPLIRLTGHRAIKPLFLKVQPDGTLFTACRLWHTIALVILRRSSMPQGTVKWFNPTKGYGFIQPQEGGKDVFVHISAVERAGLSTLNEGQTVQYELVENRGKTSAENLKVK